MSLLPALPFAPDTLVSCFWSGEVMRSRSVSEVVLSGTVDIPELPAPLTADWERDIALQLQLAPGEVEPLPLARARMRWPDYRLYVQAVAGWTRTLGLHEVLATADIALMACRGAKYHHDGVQYGGMVFCNLFLSEDKGLDLHFPAADRRIALRRGAVVVFDTGQPHAVIGRGSSSFDAARFAPGSDCSQVFLSWELPVEHASVARALGVELDIDAASAAGLDEAQLQQHGAVATVCDLTGRWTTAG